MSEMAYAVHTHACTYLLDEEGVCRWVLSPTGLAAPGSERCIGAQFVACLDLAAPGGLVGELRIGAAVLFARHENGRFVLLRTPPIEHVEDRDAAHVEVHPEAEAEAEQVHDEVTGELEPYAQAPVAAGDAHARDPFASAPPTESERPGPLPAWRLSVLLDGPPPPAPEPPPPAPLEPTAVLNVADFAPFNALQQGEDGEIIDVEEIVTFSEVTLTNPLFRPEAQPQPPPARPQRRGVVGPGRRLR